MAFRKMIAFRKLCINKTVSINHYMITSRQKSNDTGNKEDTIHVVIKTKHGLVKGREEVNDNYTTFYSFCGLPYAKAPVENLRFKISLRRSLQLAPVAPNVLLVPPVRYAEDPQPVEDWKGVLDASSTLGKVCIQGDKAALPEEDENCLHLNIYTPFLPEQQTQDNGLKAVMIYIHGGAFFYGYPLYYKFGPHFFMDYDVVFVTIAYRLGIFGFVSTHDEILSGNLGLKDARMALMWTKENIKYFGGDPEKVTIFGESAGASIVGHLLLNKDSDGLYRNAILQSGSPLCPWSLQYYPRKVAYEAARKISFTVKEGKLSSKQLRDFFLSASTSQLKKATRQIVFRRTFKYIQFIHGTYFAPVIETKHDNAFISDPIYALIESGQFNRVPIIIGINSEEFLTFTERAYQYFKWVLRFIDRNIDVIVPIGMGVKDIELKKEIGKEMKSIYVTKGRFLDNIGDSIRFFSDHCFTRSVIKHAELQSKYTNVYFYIFSYDGDMGGIPLEFKGADKVGHGEENKYLFSRQHEIYNNLKRSRFPPNDLLTQKRLLLMWTNFAKYANPTPELTDDLQNISWPTTNFPDNFLYLDIGEDLVILNHPKRTTFPRWESIFTRYSKEPLITY